MPEPYTESKILLNNCFLLKLDVLCVCPGRTTGQVQHGEQFCFVGCFKRAPRPLPALETPDDVS